MELIQCLNTHEAQVCAGEALCAFLIDAKKQSQSVLLLLSGGSAFSLLDAIPQDILDAHITIGMLDERFSKNETINNFNQLTGTSFYKFCSLMGVLFIDTRIKENETQDDLAHRFEEGLKSWIETHANGVVIATMGVGKDGHTAGIMPYPENPALFRSLFEDEEKWVVAHDAGDKNPHSLRVTVTLPFLRMVDHAVVYVVGEEKRATFERVLAENGALAETPARIIREMKDVRLFTDTIEA